MAINTTKIIQIPELDDNDRYNAVVLAKQGGLSTHTTFDSWVAQSSAPTRQLNSQDVSVRWITDRPYAINIRPEMNTISLKLGVTKGHKAWNTDKFSKLELLPGRAYVFPKHASIASVANVSSSFPLIGYSDTFRDDIADEFGNAANRTFDRIYEDLTSPAILPLAQYIRTVLINDPLGGPRAADAIGVMVVSEIMRLVAGWDASECISSLDDDRLSLILEYIDDELSEDVSTKDMAKQVGLSVFHFSRAFKTATGYSPHQYVLERRMKRAQQLLHLRNCSIAEIAYETGFSSQAHMTSTFRSRLGITPGRYRKDMIG